MDHLPQIAAAIEEGRAEKVSALVRQALDNSVSAKDIMEKGLVAGMERMGTRFKQGQAYLPEILIAARAAQAGLSVLRPAIIKAGVKPKGRVVIGTIEGDMHDIGKNLVRLVLEGEGFEVIDLGVDVSPAKFQQAAAENKADIVAISALLTTTMTVIPSVLQSLEKSALRKRVKVMIGGAPITERYAREIGADGYGRDCFEAVATAKRLLGH